MSVYTDVSLSQVQVFLRDYDLGQVTQLEGISDGIENTNYFLTTKLGYYILTLFEDSSKDDLAYPLELMGFLADRGIPSAQPIATRSGRLIGQLNAKPAVVVERLPGHSVEKPGDHQLVVIGTTLARFHRIGLDFRPSRDDSHGMGWVDETATLIRSELSDSEQKILDAAVVYRSRFDALRLPRGVIHADLFRDNVLFFQNRLSGLIDFYDAHTGPLVYDLAVTVCDWCTDEMGNLDESSAVTLVHAYCRERALNVHEKQAWVESLRAAGLRFWLSRKKDQLYHRVGAITQSKRPEKFAAIIESCDRIPQNLQVPVETLV